MRTLRRYFRLTPFERRIVFQCSVGLMMTWAGLRLVEFGVWKNVVAALTPRVRADRGDRALAPVCGTIVRMQAAAERHLPFTPNCLDRALVLWWLLRCHGIPADVQIGGRKRQGCFEAHAWVEIEGLPVADADSVHRQFVRFDGPVGVMESRTR
jgi:transglutaminase superfamily protein